MPTAGLHRAVAKLCLSLIPDFAADFFSSPRKHTVPQLFCSVAAHSRLASILRGFQSM